VVGLDGVLAIPSIRQLREELVGVIFEHVESDGGPQFVHTKQRWVDFYYPVILP
jgi:hypothetical protein